MSIRGIGRGEGGIWHGELGGTRKFAEKKHYGRDVQVQHVKAAVLDLNTVPDDRYRSLCVEDIGKLHFSPRYSGSVMAGEKVRTSTSESESASASSSSS